MFVNRKFQPGRLLDPSDKSRLQTFGVSNDVTLGFGVLSEDTDSSSTTSNPEEDVIEAVRLAVRAGPATDIDLARYNDSVSLNEASVLTEDVNWTALE